MRPGTARVAFSFLEESLGPDELCALFPQDQGYDIRWTRSDACDATRGDCLDPPDEMQTCVDARILVLESPQVARDTLGGGRSMSGLGDAAVEYVNERGEYWLWFHREEYLFFVRSALGQTDAAKAIAKHVDQELAAVLTGEPEEEPGIVAPPDDASDGETTTDDSTDIAAVFWGASGLDPLIPGISEYVHCPGRTASDPARDPRTLAGLTRCDGARRAWEERGAVEDSILERFPNPTEQEEDLASQVLIAVFLAGLQGKDGLPLFPSVGAAMPLIRKLADDRTTYTVPGQDRVTAVGRFLELVAGRDALGWEERFSPGADSSSGGGGAP